MARVTIELEMDTNLVTLPDVLRYIEELAEDGTLDYTVELDDGN
jgi:hypothetical protein